MPQRFSLSGSSLFVLFLLSFTPNYFFFFNIISTLEQSKPKNKQWEEVGSWLVKHHTSHGIDDITFYWELMLLDDWLKLTKDE